MTDDYHNLAVARWWRMACAATEMRRRHVFACYAFHSVRLSLYLKRLRRAGLYARGRLTTDDAQFLMLDCQDIAGWYPLSMLSVGSTLEWAQETYEDHPELSGLIRSTCATVYRKWSVSGDDQVEAERWAIELAAGYAAQEGVTLIRRTDEQADEGEEDQGGED